MGTIGFIGGGNMAEALIKGITSGGVYTAESVFVSDIRKERLLYLSGRYDVVAVEANSVIAEKCDIVVLSVKPQAMKEALGSIKGKLRADGVIVSIAAGVKVCDITAVLGDVGIVRVMPNTPALVAEGASAVFANSKGERFLDKVVSVLDAVGQVVVLEEEGLMDAVTAVSGSGPAYYFLLMEEMIKAGVKLGLSEKVAEKLVLQTAKGAAMLAIDGAQGGEMPGELRRKVTSPGGTTEAALKVFSEGEFGELVSHAIEKARDRGIELSSK